MTLTQSFLLSGVVFAYGVVASASRNDVDVAIVGAGLSGLAAAHLLVQANKSVVVLEARDRVGGRVLNAKVIGGGETEAGAEFVGPTQDKVLALIQELGLETFNTYDEGNSVFWANNTRTVFAADGLPPIDDTSLAQVGTIIATIDEMAASIDVSQPWKHPNAFEWDSLTFSSWVELSNPTSTTRLLFKLLSTSVFATDPAELSLLYVASYVAASGNETLKGTTSRLITTADGAQAQRVVGGTGLIATKLAEKLGNSVILNSPVRSIKYTDNGCEVISENLTINAKDVIVALSPPLAARIHYAPPLPASRDQLTQRMPMPSLGKAIAIYKTPFWREQGLNGQVQSDSGVVKASFDSSPPDASYGALMGFMAADDMRALDAASPEEIKTAVLEDYVRYFGEQANDITDFIIQRWDREEFSRGGPVAIAPPTVLTRFGYAIKEKVGRLHWAGTEGSDYWVGYMDGALRSGERAAKEILNG